MPKCYRRNGVRAWSLDRQAEVLGGLLDPSASFLDKLTPDRARAVGRVKPEWLTERAAMLRPSARRRDDIYVATLLALAVNENDLLAVLKAASERNATIYAVDSGFTIFPGGSMADAKAAADEWTRAHNEATASGWRISGVQAAADRKRAETMRKTKIARPLWRSTAPDRLSTEGVAEACGLSVKTLYAELGRRPRIRRGKHDTAEQD